MNIKEQIESLKNHGWYASCELEAEAIADTMERLLAVYEAAKNYKLAYELTEGGIISVQWEAELQTAINAVKDDAD